MNGDLEKICENTKICKAVWVEERKYRVTASTCYGLYTYSCNKNPKWEKKCETHINPKTFVSKFTEHGKKMEPEARRIFIEKTRKHVIEVGLVVSRQNLWLAVSPDGVIFENGAPVEVLEIKCPFKGAQMNIKDAIDKEFKQCLDVRGEKYVLKQGNKYYGQVQLNMAVLNVKRASFAM